MAPRRCPCPDPWNQHPLERDFADVIQLEALPSETTQWASHDQGP